MQVQQVININFCHLCFLVPSLLFVSLLLMYYACIKITQWVSLIYEPFNVVKIIFDTFIKVEFNSFKLKSRLLIFDLASQSGVQVSLNLI